MSQKVLDALRAKFGDAVVATESQHGDEVALVKRDKLVAIATWLRDDPAMAFEVPVFVTCIDLLDWRPVKSSTPPASRRWWARSPTPRSPSRGSRAPRSR